MTPIKLMREELEDLNCNRFEDEELEFYHGKGVSMVQSLLQSHVIPEEMPLMDEIAFWFGITCALFAEQINSLASSDPWPYIDKLQTAEDTFLELLRDFIDYSIHKLDKDPSRP